MYTFIVGALIVLWLDFIHNTLENLVDSIKNQNEIFKDILECMKCNTSTNTSPIKTSKDIVDKIYENITSGSDIIDKILEDNGNN